MEQVTNQIFYHIQKINPNITPSLQKGLTYTAGKQKILLFQFTII